MNTESTTKTNADNIVVIGGGASGMLAAFSACGGNCNVLLLEKNSITGKKLNITGKGRCNVTNNCTEQEFLSNAISNPKFLMKAIYRFPPEKTIELFESLGVELKTERGRRVFPVSDKAVDITNALRRAMKQAGVTVLKGDAKSIVTENGEVCGVRFCSQEGTKVLQAKAVILATGGMSYPLTGSDGSGYKMAAEIGHTIVPPRPSLVPLTVKEKWCHTLTGLSLKNVGVTFKTNDKVLFYEQGEMLFTHFGVSGPLVLSGSAYIKDFPVKMYIDMKPALSEEVLDARILSDFDEFKNKEFANSLDKLLPKAMIPVAVALSGIDGKKKTNSITKAERKKLVSLLKSIPLTVVGTRPIDEAIVTAGGINVKEINPSTMESRIVKNLYFAGEVIDVDCYTGGYNLQAAFCTGFLAGESCKKLY